MNMIEAMLIALLLALSLTLATNAVLRTQNVLERVESEIEKTPLVQPYIKSYNE